MKRSMATLLETEVAQTRMVSRARTWRFPDENAVVRSDRGLGGVAEASSQQAIAIEVPVLITVTADSISVRSTELMGEIGLRRVSVRASTVLARA